MTAPAALTTTTATRPRRWLGTLEPDDSRRGRLNATAFGVMIFFGLSFPMARILPGVALQVGEVAALVLAAYAAGRLVGADDRRGRLRMAAWVALAVVATAVAISVLYAVLAWGPLAP